MPRQAVNGPLIAAGRQTIRFRRHAGVWASRCRSRVVAAARWVAQPARAVAMDQADVAVHRTDQCPWRSYGRHPHAQCRVGCRSQRCRGEVSCRRDRHSQILISGRETCHGSGASPATRGASSPAYCRPTRLNLWRRSGGWPDQGLPTWARQMARHDERIVPSDRPVIAATLRLTQAGRRSDLPRSDGRRGRGCRRGSRVHGLSARSGTPRPWPTIPRRPSGYPRP